MPWNVCPPAGPSLVTKGEQEHDCSIAGGEGNHSEDSWCSGVLWVRTLIGLYPLPYPAVLTPAPPLTPTQFPLAELSS